MVASEVDERPIRSREWHRSSVDAEYITLDDLVDAHYTNSEQYGDVLHMFQGKHGRMERHFFGVSERCAVVLVVKRRILRSIVADLKYSRPRERASEFAGVLFEADLIVVEAKRRLQ